MMYSEPSKLSPFYSELLCLINRLVYYPHAERNFLFCRNDYASIRRMLFESNIASVYGLFLGMMMSVNGGVFETKHSNL